MLHHAAAPPIMLFVVVLLRSCSFISGGHVRGLFTHVCVYALVTVSMAAFPLRSGSCWKNSQCEGDWWGVSHRMGLLLHSLWKEVEI